MLTPRHRAPYRTKSIQHRTMSFGLAADVLSPPAHNQQNVQSLLQHHRCMPHTIRFSASRRYFVHLNTHSCVPNTFSAPRHTSRLLAKVDVTWPCPLQIIAACYMLSSSYEEPKRLDCDVRNDNAVFVPQRVPGTAFVWKYTVFV